MFQESVGQVILDVWPDVRAVLRRARLQGGDRASGRLDRAGAAGWAGRAHRRSRPDGGDAEGQRPRRGRGDRALDGAVDRQPGLHEDGVLRGDGAHRRIGEANTAPCTESRPPTGRTGLTDPVTMIRTLDARELGADEVVRRLARPPAALDPSTVLMTAVPARVAGVRDIVLVTPPGRDGRVDPTVLAAARMAGVTEGWKIGGAQAIGALAYGTSTIHRVDKIVGPGNVYVALAKSRVFGDVGIDMVAGPSEVVVVADAMADPAWIAADLLAQAEHDPMARAVLITDDAELPGRVQTALTDQLARLPRRTIAAEALAQNGALVRVRSLDDAADLANRLAPEHLELLARVPQALLRRLRHAGAVFVGGQTPEVVGDYVAGPSHVLPTAGTPRL